MAQLIQKTHEDSFFVFAEIGSEVWERLFKDERPIYKGEVVVILQILVDKNYNYLELVKRHIYGQRHE